MPEWLELHDSTLVAIEQGDSDARLLLDGYVHRWELVDDDWTGTGWTQPVRITIGDVAAPIAPPKLPADIADGAVQCESATHDNVLPLPWENSGPVTIRLILCGDATNLQIDGRGLRIEPAGEAQFIENLPGDMRSGMF